MRRRIVAVVLGLFAPLAVASTVDAASIDVSPPTITVGGTVTVSGDVRGANGQPVCAVPGQVTLTSPAFGGQSVTATAGADGMFSTRVTIPETATPGTSAVTGSCGGVGLGVQGMLTVTPSMPVMGRPAAAPAGGRTAGALLLLLALAVGAAGLVVLRRAS